MTIEKQSRASDEHILQVLHLVEQRGISYSDIGSRMGTTRSAVSGIMNRYRESYVDECECIKAENRDGGMPARWWVKK